MYRYEKFARDVSQSVWLVNNDPNDDDEGNRVGRTSIEEIICQHIQQTFHCTKSHLHACGREDIDVRCLGNGRPFAIEIENCITTNVFRVNAPVVFVI